MQFSIITVTYNSEETLNRTFESIYNQNHKDLEYIIVDGNSTDGTVELIKDFKPRFEQKFEGNLKWVSEDDQGIFDAMNKGILKATGDVISLLNSDDWYQNDTLETVSQYFQKNPKIDLLHGDMNIYDQNLNLEKVYGKRRSLLSFAEKPPFSHPTCFVKESVYEKIGNFDLKFENTADYDWMLRVYNDPSINTKYISEVLTNFRLGGNSTSGDYYFSSEIFQTLRKNNFSLPLILCGIARRTALTHTKNILSSLNLKGLLQYLRKYRKVHKSKDLDTNYNRNS